MSQMCSLLLPKEKKQESEILNRIFEYRKKGTERIPPFKLRIKWQTYLFFFVF